MVTTTFTISRSSLTSLTNSTTLITGGSSGIGLATVILLHSLPSNNIIILDIRPPPPPLNTSSRVRYIQTDITSWASQRAAFKAGYAIFGRIDNVFVNAGITEYKDQIFDSELDDKGELKEPDRRVINLNLNAANDTVKLAVFYMRMNGEKGGNIVMTASMAGYLASAGAPLYSASKHGIVGLMRAIKSDALRLNIVVSVVAPGITVTPILGHTQESKETPEELAKKYHDMGIPLNSADDVADAVVYLFAQGIKSSGKGLMIQAGKFADVEAGAAKGRKVWMGEEMLELFKSGRNTRAFLPSKL
ncbi:hypothetical protein BJ878DRAFT_439532 [Calycina marina]|uniref:NAD(P)-binding protein n=1 Tax=Calycina marina TaxID=1763456 RepID=A0A9P8CG09_9HELO|nr:hypothetical protein BJ878DRAFT_439532 [Calycina marina]